MALLHEEGFCAGTGAVGNRLEGLDPVDGVLSTPVERSVIPVVRVITEGLAGRSAGEPGAVLHDIAHHVYRLGS
jgi:hypothetical protein